MEANKERVKRAIIGRKARPFARLAQILRATAPSG